MGLFRYWQLSKKSQNKQNRKLIETDKKKQTVSYDR